MHLGGDTCYSRRNFGFKLRRSLTKDSPMWRNISKYLNASWNCTSFKFSSSDNIRFWEDVWIGPFSFASIFIEVFNRVVKTSIFSASLGTREPKNGASKFVVPSHLP